MEDQNSGNHQLIEKRYQELIGYYKRSSVRNKRYYKCTRTLTIVLGALVTLIASLSSSIVIKDSSWGNFFIILTPVTSAVLTITAGFSQAFQWGSAWQNMVLAAQKLQMEYDRFLVTPSDKINYSEEMENLNKVVISESEMFFDRLLGGLTSIRKPDPQELPNQKKEQ